MEFSKEDAGATLAVWRRENAGADLGPEAEARALAAAQAYITWAYGEEPEDRLEARRAFRANLEHQLDVELVLSRAPRMRRIWE